MAGKDSAATPAVRALRAASVFFTAHPYRYEEHGGTRVAAQELGVDEHEVVKTLVMEADGSRPLLVLMHGDREVSTRELARQLGARRVAPCDVRTAERLTGYLVGGISPFGTRTRLDAAVERTVLALPRIFVNGGRRGLLVELDPAVLIRLLRVIPVDAAQAGSEGSSAPM